MKRASSLLAGAGVWTPWSFAHCPRARRTRTGEGREEIVACQSNLEASMDPGYPLHETARSMGAFSALPTENQRTENQPNQQLTKMNKAHMQEGQRNNQ